MNKVFCVGDGYAHGHIWPEWPQILSALLYTQELVTISGVGAGNEFLINGLLQYEFWQDTVIFQWALPNRFDKLVQDSQWKDIGLQDDIYHFNFYNRQSHTWWLSSGSTNPDVRKYHEFYIQSQQSLQRTNDYKKLLEGFLGNFQCRYIDISTQDQDRFSRQPRFAHVRGHEVQPSPVVHLAYLEEIILPQMPYVVDQSRLERLRQSIFSTPWIPYDPDRESIWQNIVNNLDTV